MFIGYGTAVAQFLDCGRLGRGQYLTKSNIFVAASSKAVDVAID